jgi:cytochrome b561
LVNGAGHYRHVRAGVVDLPLSPEKFSWYGLHKSIGATLIAAVFLRFIWRQLNAVPPLPEAMKWHERMGAHLGHFGLYGLMLALPMSGWLMSSAAGFTVSVFGWFTLPDLIAADKALSKTLAQVHELLAFAIIGLAAIHAGAALIHHFIKKDTVLKRMLPW